jgi:hypothetical protein
MWDRTLSPWRVLFWQKMLSECLVILSFVDISMENWAREGGCVMFSWSSSMFVRKCYDCIEIRMRKINFAGIFYV